ncbi:MAG TPA: hypothetical protein VN648_26795 [Candidatus Methylomirabilis sp.]|nr:hypothetical protein [Candidatus Methylomirabilis sp.]
MPTTRKRRIDMRESAKAADYGPFHVVVIQDPDYYYGFKGQLQKRILFAGLWVESNGYGYTFDNPPECRVTFNGNDLGVVVALTLSGDGGSTGKAQIADAEVTDWGQLGGHSGEDAQIIATWDHVDDGHNGAWTLRQIDVDPDNKGTGYTGRPLIGIAFGAIVARPARVRCNIVDGQLDSVDVLDGGLYQQQSGEPHPTVTLNQPVTDYPCVPSFEIYDPADPPDEYGAGGNTTGRIYGKAGGIVDLADPNHHIVAGDEKCRFFWRESGALHALYANGSVTVLAVDGNLVSYEFPLNDVAEALTTFDYGPEVPDPLPDPITDDDRPTCWLTRRLVPACATVTPPAAETGQGGYTKKNGLAGIVVDDRGAGTYTPSSSAGWYPVTITGGTKDQAATAQAWAGEDGGIDFVLITDQGKGWTVAPSSVTIAGGSASCHGIISAHEDAWTFRMHNPLAHGIAAGAGGITLVWKWGTAWHDCWQYQYVAARYDMVVEYVCNGCITLYGGLDGPRPDETTSEMLDPAGKAWSIPTDDDYPVQLYQGACVREVLAPGGLGATIAMVWETVDVDKVEGNWPPEDWDKGIPGRWVGWWTDLNAEAQVS